MASTIEFALAILRPMVFDVQKRIEELRGYLDPNNPHYQPEPQHINIRAAIKLYEDGKINGTERVFIKDGKLVPEKERFTGGWSISEGGVHYNLAQGHAYGHGPFGTDFHDVSIQPS